jgi:hypothetical protein
MQLTRHNIRLHKDDITWLRETYPDLSASAVIRTLIERHRRELEAKHPYRRPPDALTITESRP